MFMDELLTTPRIKPWHEMIQQRSRRYGNHHADHELRPITRAQRPERDDDQQDRDVQEVCERCQLLGAGTSQFRSQLPIRDSYSRLSLMK